MNTNSGCKYDFNEFCRIMLKVTNSNTVYTKEKGIIARRNTHENDQVQLPMHNLIFWGEALKIIVYILNRVNARS